MKYYCLEMRTYEGSFLVKIRELNYTDVSDVTDTDKEEERISLKITSIKYDLGEESLIIRTAEKKDAKELTALRMLIDAETEFLDRTREESTLTESDFEERIEEDEAHGHHLFLIALVNDQIIGFSRCIAHSLKRFRHGASFGICLLKAYQGKGIGKRLMTVTTEWADKNQIERIELTVVEDNIGAIHMYRQFGFVKEGIRLSDRKHADGFYHNTVLMSRIPSRMCIPKKDVCSGTPDNIQLRPIDHSNWETCIALSVGKEQQSYVATNAYSLLQAQYSEGLYPLGIYEDDTMVGFIMYEQDFQADDMGMCRLMIDEKHQKKGYGRQAIYRLLEYVETHYSKKPFYTSFEPDNDVACRLYESVGFKDTGEMIGDEKLYQYMPEGE